MLIQASRRIFAWTVAVLRSRFLPQIMSYSICAIAAGGANAQLPSLCQNQSGMPINLITQHDIDRNHPFSINLPGSYCLSEDIRYKAPNDSPGHEAIVVNAPNVSISFADHTITDVSPSGRAHTALRIFRGNSNVHILGPGNIVSFQFGVDASSRVFRSTDQKITTQHIKITNLTFAGNSICDEAIMVQNAIYGDISHNNISGCIGGILATGSSGGTTLQYNAIGLGETRLNLQIAIAANRTNGIVISNNSIVGSDSLQWPSFQQTGIYLYHGNRYDNPSWWGRNNTVEHNNIFYTDRPIFVFGSGQGSNNTIRFNGVNPGKLPPLAHQKATYKTHEAGILISNENRTSVHDNLILTSPNKIWPYGVSLRNVSFAPRSSQGTLKRPAFYNNRTCGVQEDLFAASVSPRFFDQDNQWGVCAYVP